MLPLKTINVLYIMQPIKTINAVTHCIMNETWQSLQLQKRKRNQSSESTHIELHQPKPKSQPKRLFTTAEKRTGFKNLFQERDILFRTYLQVKAFLLVVE